MPSNTPSVRVVVRLPWNRPENAEPDPPYIEWTPEKADILWKVIEKSRSSDSGGADWKGLAAHLEVPLPYLLYRVNARFQEEIRGLKDIQGALSPSPIVAANPKFEALLQAERPLLAIRTGVNNSKLSSSKLNTPRNVRARLNSLGNNSPRPKKAISSSTLTVQGIKRVPLALRPQSPSSSDGSLSSDDMSLKEEEAERTAEEQDALDRKLEELTRLITNDTLGLVRTHKSKRSIDRGRAGVLSSSNPNSAAESFRGDSLSSRSDNQSLSSVSSPQGSIPEIPSPPTDSQPQSPLHWSRHNMSPAKSSSPAAVSPRSALSHSHIRRHRQLASEHGSSHESEASSFSDLSDASLSASALESALMSNIATMRSTTSRL
ncbi:hypothetical protein P691DRAFT_665889 [Macrolepiota fuliginosa MF-IS2]|uniref:Autophagy-related protein 29 n=1 Tax=Macrolepiota fuliginosa MF-IS2 TaxID=1400762 RepID=A0A9P5XJ72_9AGAR|nr:hypothetical protein P691DRAFT_665889 [Macrolepiota fuliginosa MF-IS2]